MKDTTELKNFDDYLKKRLNEQEIAEIEEQAKVEFEKFKNKQEENK